MHTDFDNVGNVDEIFKCPFLLEPSFFKAFEANIIKSLCLASPHKPQYGGGIVVNPELDHGLKGWTAFGDAKIERRASKEGNTFVVAHNRQHPHDSFSQKFYLEKRKLYTLSAWLQVSQGSAKIAAVFKTASCFEHAGWVAAQSGCWSMLKGGSLNNTLVEIWADSISLQPFTKKQWRSHQRLSTEKVEARKSTVRFVAVDSQGNPVPNATFSVAQQRSNFPFGCAMSRHILTNPTYQKWFASRFTVTTFENEMKWPSVEWSEGQEDYSVPDAMLRFAKSHNIAVLGHNVVWADPKFEPSWVRSLSASQLQLAVDRRINSLVRRYAGQLIAWDVENENLHFDFFESMLGRNATTMLFDKVHELDRGTTLFLNEFNTIEEIYDADASPTEYLQKIGEIRAGGYSGPMGIGLEAHFRTPNLPYMRASIDRLAVAGMPVWLTEVDVRPGAKQAQYLEAVLREAHAHPHVSGIVMWAAWRPEGCYEMCLTDNNFRNLPTGDVVDKLISEWTHTNGFCGTTDSLGHFKTRLYHGDYKATVSHPSASPVDHSFTVGSEGKARRQTLRIKVSV
ncbi:Endo-1,4-beta-xylanase [Bertholletia excelsa]